MFWGRMVTVRGVFASVNFTRKLAFTRRPLGSFCGPERLEEVLRATDLDLALGPAPEDLHLLQRDGVDALDVAADERVGTVVLQGRERVLGGVREPLRIAEEQLAEQLAVERDQLLVALGVHRQLAEPLVVPSTSYFSGR